MVQDSDYEKIPLKVLKKELPDLKTRGRQPYIDKLKKVSPDKLNKFAAYFSMNKTSSMYLFKTSNPQDKARLTEDNLLALKGKKIEQDNGEICIIQDIVIDKNRNEAYLQIDGYSSTKTLQAVEPEDLKHFTKKYKKEYIIRAIVHIGAGDLECRTGRQNKADLAANILSKTLYKEKGKFGLILLKKDQQNKINQTAKSKKATIYGIKWGGCEKIRLEGEDIERTIKQFKQKGIDFESMEGAQIIWDDRRSEEGFTFSSDGKIKFKRTDYPYDKIKNVL